jgi:hypothetical protein
MAEMVQEVFVRQAPTTVFDYPRTNIMDKEWELLILLDGCRVDTLQEVAPQYEWLPAEIPADSSIAGASKQWMERTFRDAEFPDLSYITSNPHSDIVLSDRQFQQLDEVWKYEWEDDIGTVLPRAVTNQVITHGRESQQAGRTIVHYMQPHFPAVTHPELGSEMTLDEVGEGWTGNIWDQLLEGKIPEQKVRTAFRENLCAVLDEVAVLINNVDADRTVLSADHGNAFGERGYYGHGDYRVDAVREVPWVELTAEDNETHEPETKKKQDNYDIEDQLESLGYV